LDFEQYGRAADGMQALAKNALWHGFQSLSKSEDSTSAMAHTEVQV
jgi:hypothetical protein